MASSERFGYEWEKYPDLLDHYEEQFLKWAHPLEKSFFKDKTVLDAGCGMGRNSYWCLRYGAKKVVAFDLDKRSVSAARRTLGKFQNAEVRVGDIESFRADEPFDIVFSIGVIHHLTRPEAALRNLISAVRAGGKLLIWVYGYEGNEWIMRYVNPVRSLTSRLPIRITHALAYLFSVPLYAYVKWFPQRRPYLQFLKRFGFQHLHSIVFDQLLPRVANYWTRGEVKKLFRDLPGIERLEIYPVNGMSWTAIATIEN